MITLIIGLVATAILIVTITTAIRAGLFTAVLLLLRARYNVKRINLRIANARVERHIIAERLIRGLSGHDRSLLNDMRPGLSTPIANTSGSIYEGLVGHRNDYNGDTYATWREMADYWYRFVSAGCPVATPWSLTDSGTTTCINCGNWVYVQPKYGAEWHHRIDDGGRVCLVLMSDELPTKGVT